MKTRRLIVSKSWPAFLAALTAYFIVTLPAIAQPFTVQGPGVDPGNFRVTVFASGLNFPLGMTKLADDSLLVTVNQGSSFFSSYGKLLRLTDTNGDGVADDPGTVLYTNLPSTLTALRVAGSLILVTGQGKPITVLRVGATPADPLVLVGQILFNYPASWEHQHSALGLRTTPDVTNAFDLVFQIGSDSNFAVTTRTVGLTNSNVPGAIGTLTGDSVFMLTLIDNGGSVLVTNVTQLATGVRNPASCAFQTASGDLYFPDNGIDGLVDPNQALSADELNFIARTNLGGAPEFFGFPSNYNSYRTNFFVGGAGVPALIAFQPIPDPFVGHESKGANYITFAPPGFPAGLNTGVFIGFHGRFDFGGTNNVSNPLVYASPPTGAYFDFIAGQQLGIGHLDGLLATSDSLFVADLVTNGNTGAGAGAGVIYQIKSVLPPIPPALSVRIVSPGLELTWDRGGLQQASDVNGPWTNMVAFSPQLILPTGARQFFRAKF